MDGGLVRIHFTRASGLVAWLIRAVTGGSVTHVGLGLSDGRIVHADQGGVQVAATMADFLGEDRRLAATYETVVEPKIDEAKILEDFVGRPYDYDGLIGALPGVLAWRWWKVRIGNPLAKDREFFCSEFVCELLKPSGIMPAKDPGTLTPAALLRWVSRSPHWAKRPGALHG